MIKTIGQETARTVFYWDQGPEGGLELAVFGDLELAVFGDLELAVFGDFNLSVT